MRARAAEGELELGARGPAGSGLRFPAMRTAFTSAGGRHLQGYYADLDALARSLAVLDRQEVAA